MNCASAAVGALLFLIFAIAESCTAAGVDPGARPARLSFPSAGRKIRADLYFPPEPDSERTIILLHGAGGILFDGPRMRRIARALAARGNRVYLLHYFNRTGTIGARDGEMQAHFDDWLKTVREGIAWVDAREGKGGRKIGIFGYSLGGFLAIAAASDNPLVGAVTEEAGGIWNSQERRVGKMPPVLMVHGMADGRVPFEKYANGLLGVLRARGGSVETIFVPGEGHVFSEAAMRIVRPKIADFFAGKLPSLHHGE